MTRKALVFTDAGGTDVEFAPTLPPLPPKRAPRPRTKTASVTDIASSIEATFLQRAVLTYERVDKLPFAQQPYATGSWTVVDYARRVYGNRPVEYFGIVGLNAANRIVGHAILGQGSASHTTVDKAELVRFLALSGSVGCVAFHNHPTGRLEWSPQDLDMTRQLAQLTYLVDAKLVDHVLLTADSYRSMIDEGNPALEVRRDGT